MLKRPIYQSERQLVTLLQNYNKASFEYLYDHYAPGLYGIACKIVKDENIAADVVQDSFIKIWRNIGRYSEDKGTLFTWMLNITRRTAIDRLRTDLKHQNNIAWEQIREDDLSPTAIITPILDIIDVRSMLERLRPERKRLIELVYFEGYTHQEACEYLELPLSTVKSRIRKALIELRQVFDISSESTRLA
jgi:RNA polymerase sigma factor (sigma-70 family)